MDGSCPFALPDRMTRDAPLPFWVVHGISDCCRMPAVVVWGLALMAAGIVPILVADSLSHGRMLAPCRQEGPWMLRWESLPMKEDMPQATVGLDKH